jgi:hypothetical protein
MVKLINFKGDLVEDQVVIKVKIDLNSNKFKECYKIVQM